MTSSVVEQAEPNQIEGTWELIDISAYTLMDSPPYGFAARKYYFEQGGKLYVIDPDEKFNADMESVPYTFKDSELSFDIPEEGELHVPVEFIAHNRMVLVYGARNRWTYEKLEGEKPYNQEIEPRSVAVLQTIEPEDQLSNLDIHYDQLGQTDLTLSESIVGVWEVTSYSGIPAADCPPYGFPNDKWVFTNTGEYYRLSPNETALPKGAHAKYEISGKMMSMFVDDQEAETQEIGFNSWGHLIIGGDEVRISLKLLNKNPKIIQELPVKIALLTLKD